MVLCECGERAVIVIDGKPLCRRHFEEWLEGAVVNELEKFVKKNDVLAIAVSGGKDSVTLLNIVHRWGGARFFAILVDEGIKGYRDRTRAFLERFCRERGIELHVYGFKKEFGKTLDEFIRVRDDRGLNMQACTICGTFRRYLLNRYARELGATKILFAHNLDDEVQTFLMNLFTGNLGQMSRKGELVGVIESDMFVQRFKPMIRIPERANTVYALLNFPDLPGEECPYLKESVRYRIRRLLLEMESRNPGSKKRMLNVYLNRILPVLKRNASGFHGRLRKCEVCGEPSSRKICKACEIRRLLQRS